MIFFIYLHLLLKWYHYQCKKAKCEGKTCLKLCPQPTSPPAHQPTITRLQHSSRENLGDGSINYPHSREGTRNITLHFLSFVHCTTANEETRLLMFYMYCIGNTFRYTLTPCAWVCRCPGGMASCKPCPRWSARWCGTPWWCWPRGRSRMSRRHCNPETSHGQGLCVRYRVSHEWVSTLFSLFSRLSALIQRIVLHFFNSSGNEYSNTHLAFHPSLKIYQITVQNLRQTGFRYYLVTPCMYQNW